MMFVVVPEVTEDVDSCILSINASCDIAMVPLDDRILSQADSRHSSLSLSSAGVGIQILLERMETYLGQRNTYGHRMSVSGRTFYGREKVIVGLSQIAQSGRFAVICGLRKIGKTTLVDQLLEVRLPREVAAIKLDLQACRTDDIKYLYCDIEDKLKMHSIENGKDQEAAAFTLSSLGQDWATRASYETVRGRFETDMRKFLYLLSQEKRKVLIVLDELDIVVPGGGRNPPNGARQFFQTLRGLAQEFGGRVLSNISIAATAAITEDAYWGEEENPLVLSYEKVVLRPLDYRECSQMVRTLGKMMGVSWSDSAIEKLYRETGGHPSLTREFCRYLVEENPARPLEVDEAKIENGIVSYMRDEANTSMEMITNFLSSHVPHGNDILKEIVLRGSSSDLGTIRKLIEYQIIADGDSGYRTTFQLLDRWIKGRAWS